MSRLDKHLVWRIRLARQSRRTSFKFFRGAMDMSGGRLRPARGGPHSAAAETLLPVVVVLGADIVDLWRIRPLREPGSANEHNMATAIGLADRRWERAKRRD